MLDFMLNYKKLRSSLIYVDLSKLCDCCLLMQIRNCLVVFFNVLAPFLKCVSCHRKHNEERTLFLK